MDRLAVGGLDRRRAVLAGTGNVQQHEGEAVRLAAGEAAGAVAARREGCGDVVADREVGDVHTDLLDDSGTLAPEDHGKRAGDVSVDDVTSGAASGSCEAGATTA
jgi:hypothetical protein